MKKSLIKFVMIIPLALMVLFTLSCSDDNGVTDPIANTQSDIDAIEEIWVKYAQTVNDFDFEGWLALWDVNGIRMQPDDQTVVGIDQIRAQTAVNFSLPGSVMTIDSKETLADGSLGWSRGNFSVIVPLPDGSTFTLDGKFSTVFKKQSDGSWRIYCDCFNFHEL